MGNFTRREAVKMAVMIGLAGQSTRLPAEDNRLAEVVARNTVARGGTANLDKVRSLAIDVEIIEGDMTLTGRYAANGNGLVRIDVYAGTELVASEGIDPVGVWLLGKDGPKPSVAIGAANALLHGAENHLFGWHRFPERGHTLTLMPPAKIGDTIHEVVEIKYSTGHISYFYVDPITWLAVRRRDERAYHPDLDVTKQRIESRASDWTAVDGVLAAHRNEDYDIDSGKLLASNRVRSRRINPSLASDYFDRNRRAGAIA